MSTSLSVRGNLLLNAGSTIGSKNTVAPQKSITISNAGGILHGTWSADTALAVTSDRRLKQDIMPLGKTLVEKMSRVLATQGNASSLRSAKNRYDAKVYRYRYTAEFVYQGGKL